MMPARLAIHSVNLKANMPSVPEALQRLDRELMLACRQGLAILKLIHGYGSSGVGGDIRVAVQKRLHEMLQAGEIRACIFGEDWSKSNNEAWQLLQSRRELRNDPDLGRRNQGITIVVL